MERTPTSKMGANLLIESQIIKGVTMSNEIRMAGLKEGKQAIWIRYNMCEIIEPVIPLPGIYPKEIIKLV